jgi:arylsulfatase A-like enzyme
LAGIFLVFLIVFDFRSWLWYDFFPAISGGGFHKGEFMIKRMTIMLTVICMMCLSFCGKDSSSKSVPASILWDKEQSVLKTADGTTNLWCGFDIRGDFFAAGKTISKFILWREKQEKKKITLHYLLRGKPIKVFVNSKDVFTLKPRYKLEKFTAAIPLLKGFNFIEFRKTGKSIFKIKTADVGSPSVEQTHHLVRGQAFSRFHPAGAGRIVLNGNGKVRIRVVEFVHGQKKTREEELEPGFLSNTVKYNFQFESPGFIRVSAADGEFNIAEYTFEKKPGAASTVAGEQEYERVMKEKPGIHILLIDGCHAGHLGVYGYRRDTSPNVDRFARDSVVFDNAYANATFTRSSVASIFTGFHPHRHKLRIITNRLPRGLFMLPEFMQKKGYKTALLTEAGNISRFFGFAQGVDQYRKVFRRWDDPRYLENNMYNFFCEWLENKGPLFTYVHFRAPHFPIIPPPPFLDMYKKEKSGNPEKDRLIFHLKDLGEAGYRFSPQEVQDVIDDYDSSIRYVDAEVGRILDKLKEKGLYESSFIIFTSDHGEALYEHGYWGHGQTVYHETARVPLIVKFPAKMGLKGRIERVTQLVDIFPTFAALFGERRYFDGESLLNSIRLKKEDDRFGFSTSFGMPPSISIRWRSWYYIIHLFSNREELFDLKTDPLENVVGLEANKDLLTFFRARFLDWYIDFDNIERTSQSVDLKKLPKGEYDNLKSLGYID